MAGIGEPSPSANNVVHMAASNSLGLCQARLCMYKRLTLGNVSSFRETAAAVAMNASNSE